MVLLAVFVLFNAACLGYGWDSTLSDSYPSTTDGWSLRATGRPITMSQPLMQLYMRQNYFEYIRSYMIKTAASDSDLKRMFDFFNQANFVRNFIDNVFDAWDMYKKEIALTNKYAKAAEYEQTTIEVNHELEESTRETHEVEESEQSTIKVDGVATEAAAVKVEYRLNDGTSHRSGRILKTMVETKSEATSPLTLPEDSTASSSEKEYSFVTNLNIGRGIPGVDYPDYNDIPATSFSCSNKTYIPGFYADLETGCQVFHACWSDRRESLLCPVGTTFNQTLLKCDYWYNTNCSMAPLFFDLNVQFRTKTPMTKVNQPSTSQNEYSVTSETTNSYEATSDDSPSEKTRQPKMELTTEDWNQITDFLPIKAKVTVYSKSDGHEKGYASDEPQHSAWKQVLTVQEKAGKVGTASRIVDGAIDLAERVAKETAKLVMDVIRHRVKSEEKARKVDAAAKIVDEATDLAARVAKETAQLVSRITLEAMRHQADKSNVNRKELKYRSQTPKSVQQKPVEVNPRFVVEPVALPEIPKQIHQMNLHSKDNIKDHILEVIDKAFEMVLSVNILPATREAILKNYIKVALQKKH